MITASACSTPLNGGDGTALLRLAERDSAAVPPGRLLGAWVGGDLVAAHSVTRGGAIAHPFRPTEGVAGLLERRAQQLRVGDRPRRRPVTCCAGARARRCPAPRPARAGGRAMVLERC
ncbi:MAG: hypothetical protein ACXWFN_00335 [Solirubrobacterales bacterium]